MAVQPLALGPVWNVREQVCRFEAELFPDLHGVGSVSTSPTQRHPKAVRPTRQPARLPGANVSLPIGESRGVDSSFGTPAARLAAIWAREGKP